MSSIVLHSLRAFADDRATADAAHRLFNRNFLLLSQAQLVSQFGNQAFTIALTFWIAEATGSATLSGIMVLAGVLPLIVLAPLTGTFVDRQRSPLSLIVSCDLLSGVFSMLLAAGFLIGPVAWRPAMLFAGALLIGVCSAVFEPAVTAFAPDLVPEDRLEAANAFRQGSRQVTVLAALSAGGILYSIVGPAALFLLNGLSFLFASATELLIRPVPRAVCHRDRAADAEPTFARQAVDGFRYIAAQPGMITVFVVGAAFNALLMPISLLLPVYAITSLGGDARCYGFLLAAIGAGAIAGSTLAGAAGPNLTGSSRRRLLAATYAGLALSLAVLGQVHSRWVALAILFLTGVLSGTINVLMLSIIQRRTSTEFRGRVISLHTMMNRVLVPFGLVGGGALADLTGRNVPLVYGLCGAGALLTVVLLISPPKARGYLAG